MKRKYKADYTQLKRKMSFRLLGMAVIAFVIIYVLYFLFWKGRGGNWVVSFLRNFVGMEDESARDFYQVVFRNYMDVIWLVAIVVVFLIFLAFFLEWFTHYFNAINKGIDALLDENAAIHLPAEMAAIEKKLNTVKQTLEKRAFEAQSAEQRKNELVMYLAHDIKTPLTSVIGYLSLLEEAPDMPTEQKAKYVHITLEKAYRLEQMINEFFEITRYNLQQIQIENQKIDLYFMLVQITDELTPILSENGNTTTIRADENLTIYGDPGYLARVFNNILKNAAAYSYPNTDILISAEQLKSETIITFQNEGQTIPREKLNSIFEKFFRMDEARTSNTGGAGLGLAIAKEILTLHGGAISAQSENHVVQFTVTLPQPE